MQDPYLDYKFRKTIRIGLYFIVLISIIGCKSPQLMPYDKFSLIKDLELPRIIKFKSGSKELLYFGSYHSNNKTDTLFGLIQKEYLDFEPDYVLHEGNSDWPIYSDVDSTILISGEPGFIIQLSKKESVNYGTIEPKEDDEYEHLLKYFDLDWVVLMYMCRQIDQQQRFAESYKTTEPEYIQNMNYFFRMLAENGVPIQDKQLTYKFWKEKYKMLLKRELNWREFNPNVYYPNYYLTILNEVNRASDEFRNTHMIEKIVNQLEIDNKVFVLVGGGHLIVQEKLLRHKFGQIND